jgi:hypothetical protein
LARRTSIHIDINWKDSGVILRYFHIPIVFFKFNALSEFARWQLQNHRILHLHGIVLMYRSIHSPNKWRYSECNTCCGTYRITSKNTLELHFQYKHLKLAEARLCIASALDHDLSSTDEVLDIYLSFIIFVNFLLSVNDLARLSSRLKVIEATHILLQVRISSDGFWKHYISYRWTIYMGRYQMHTIFGRLSTGSLCGIVENKIHVTISRF